MKKDSLGDRMKGYENVSKNKLTRRTPAIIRIDGKAFHTWTKQLSNVDESLNDSPFSVKMNQAMAKTTELLVANIQNAVFGYTQSDEISILLNDWKTFTTDPWYGNDVQKIVSVAASMATAYFGEACTSTSRRFFAPAMFDARVSNYPREEVTNYFVWRQQDATRNSINMLGQFYFSHKQLQGKNVNQVQDMLMLEHGVNWNDIDTWMKRGTCVTRGARKPLFSNGGLEGYAPATGIQIDREIPIFTADRAYVDQFLKAEES